VDADVIIVGAGPAGCTAARVCAGAGLETIIIDRATFPRVKPCGGALSPRAAADIRRIFVPRNPEAACLCPAALGVPATSLRAHFHRRRTPGMAGTGTRPGDIRSLVGRAVLAVGGRTPRTRPSPEWDGWRRLRVESERPLAYVTHRSVLDEHLLRLAVEAGAKAIEGMEVVSWGQDAGGVWVVVKDPGPRRSYPAVIRTLHAAFLIGADGSSSVVARGLYPSRTAAPGEAGGCGDPERADPRLRGPAVLCLSAFIPLSRGAAHKVTGGSLDLHFGLLAGGYGWIFPAASGLAVGVRILHRPGRTGSSPAGRRRTRARMGEALSRMLRHYGLDCGHPHSHPARSWLVPLGGWRRRHGAGRVLLAGDAAGTADPLTGQGIGPAVRSAELAARTVIRWVRESTTACLSDVDGGGRTRQGERGGAPRSGGARMAAALVGPAGAAPAAVDPGADYAVGLWSGHLASQRRRLWWVRLASRLPPGGQVHLFRRSVFTRLAAEMQDPGSEGGGVLKTPAKEVLR